MWRTIICVKNPILLSSFVVWVLKPITGAQLRSHHHWAYSTGAYLTCRNETFGKTARQGMASVTSAKLAAVPNVDIDDNGRFKYILLKITDGSEHKYIVRGYARAGFHADIYDEVEEGIRGLGLGINCHGGGRILHEPLKKSLFVFGYSQGYGRADHGITTNILKKHFQGYASITWSNEGY